MRQASEGGVVSGRRARTRVTLALMGCGLGCGLAVAVPPTAWASALAGGDDPAGRGLQLLQARETALGNQTAQATETARRRGLMLYRLLLHEAAERRSGARTGEPLHEQAGTAPGGRAISLGVAILARELDEAAVLRDELERVHEDRRSAAEGMPQGRADVVPAPGPIPEVTAKWGAPVAGSITTSYGVARDDATGGWLFRTAAGWSPRPGTAVVAPADGRVARVAPDVLGGWALVLTHADGLTTVLGGLDSVAVGPRDLVRRGALVGSAGAALRVEVSHGRTPVDPAGLFASPRGRAQKIAGAAKAPARTR